MVFSGDMEYFSIDVLVSSYGQRLISFLESLPDKVDGVRYLVGHQNPLNLNIKKILDERDDIIYFPLNTIGVTRSRNFLLESSSADILYFCDDDVSLVKDFFSILRNAHNSRNESVITFVVNNEKGEPRKIFPKKSKNRNFLSILSVGTIEISLKRVDSFNLIFPEDMGAGGTYPIGDEAVFLSGFLNKGKKIFFENKVICTHPDDSSGALANISTSYSRGLTLSRVFPILSIFFAIPFFLFRRKLFLVDGRYYKGFRAFIYGIFRWDL